MGAAFDPVSRVLYRDQLMLVIDKPSGLAVHASGRADDHLGLHLQALKFGYVEQPELAHRLDRDTSGCLVLGRNKRALRKLGALFAHGHVGKTYWAVVVGTPPGESGVIDKPLLKAGPPWAWRVKVDEKAGQPSVTEWRLLGRGGRLSWIECRPRTGRTHQIRAHLASIGLPIVGDPIYGQGTADIVAPRLHLHARHISVPLYHPQKPPVEVTAPVSAHMHEILARCGWTGEAPDGPEPAASAPGGSAGADTQPA